MKQAQTVKQQQLLIRWSEAIATPAFRSRHLTLDALSKVLPHARQRSLQRLVQSLIREDLIEAKTCRKNDGDSYWLSVADNTQLRFDYLSSGRMCSWELSGNLTAHELGQVPQLIEFPSDLLKLLKPVLKSAVCIKALERLALELDDSFINDTLCLAFHDAWTLRLQHQMLDDNAPNLFAWLSDQSGAINPTLLLEQWGTLGHPWHPNYKTKPGLATHQIVNFSPEFEASFPVILCALHRQYAHIEAIPGTPEHWTWWDIHFPEAATQLIAELQLLGLDATQYIPLPVHPWQADEQLKQAFSNEISARLLVLSNVVAFNGHPSMSFRTVVPDASSRAPMIKLPVALRLTSVQRTLSPRSVRMGPRISHLLRQILDQEPHLQRWLSIVPERIGVHYQPQSEHDDRARHLSALYRDNPLSFASPGELVVPVGSLFAHDLKGQPLLRQWIQRAYGREDAAAMQSFFRNYLSIAVPGLLGMYLLYGIAFEAHQQNSFMVMGADGHPDRLLLRDFGDIRIDRSTFQTRGLDIELHDPTMTLYDSADHVRDKLLHSAFMCHLGELTLLCARHWEVSPDWLWQELAEHVSQCFDAFRGRVDPLRWETERKAVLESDWPAKSFMRMRLLDNQADIVGRLSNPLRVANHAA
ncbi:MAG: Siderophore synthetase superfamily, group [Pseudomonas sp.]|uniref:IucA/IucC family protein n=1 Tax=Pseudomonas sp. TaxID=306 RepID=UPI002606C8AE|nr:IucA/IucC family protein [Pseudomonas sp.]MDB6049532.1 Siderophore synthetase superfamily, group [Pseudomonas sp.]